MIFSLLLLSTFLLPCLAPPAPPPPTDHREEKICKVSGRSLDSAIKIFLSHHVLKLSPTEAEKKLLLAKEMAQYLTTEVDVLSKMDTCRLVPLYNLIQYHISGGAEKCKHTEKEWRSLLLADLLAEETLFSSVGLAKLSITEREKIFQSADTMVLVTLGCVNNVLLGQVKNDLGQKVREREGKSFGFIAQFLGLGALRTEIELGGTWSIKSTNETFPDLSGDRNDSSPDLPQHPPHLPYPLPPHMMHPYPYPYPYLNKSDTITSTNEDDSTNKEDTRNDENENPSTGPTENENTTITDSIINDAASVTANAINTTITDNAANTGNIDNKENPIVNTDKSATTDNTANNTDSAAKHG